MSNVFKRKYDTKPNIFTISPKLTQEDRFTLHWEYLLNRLPELGQLLIDYLSETSGIDNSIFLEALDQSRFYFSKRVRPDLMIFCKDYCIVCEHKLMSPLGKTQLQRYCELSHTEKQLYVLLITNKIDEKINDKVLDAPNYLKPLKSKHPYYLWEKFYPFVQACEKNLAKEFAKYMDDLGMAPWISSAWNDIFIDETSAKQFRKLLETAIHYFKEKIRPKKSPKDPVSLGFQIQKPQNLQIRVIHFLADKTPGHLDHGLNGRGIFLEVKGKKDSEGLKDLGYLNEEINSNLGIITIRTPEIRQPDSNNYILLREYAVNLENVLRPNMKDSEERILTFSRECLEHLKKSIKEINHQ